MSTPSFTVTSALFILSALDALESVARRQITVVRFFQILEVELAVAQERISWILAYQACFGEPKPTIHPGIAARLSNGVSAATSSTIAPSMVRPAAGEGDGRPLRFGTRFVYAEWKETFDAIFNASIPSDEGDDIDLSKADNGPPPAIKVVEDAVAALGISLSATRSFVPPSNAVSTPSSSSATCPSTRKSRRPTKRRKTGSIFVDIAAAEVDDTEEEDEGEQMELYRALEVQPAGRTRYAKDLNRLFERYQGETPDAANNAGGSPHDEVTIPIDFFNMFGSGENGHRIYVIEFFTMGNKSVAMLCEFSLFG
ncbi:hypothetical protein PAXINDRAFT_21955 [Paxillus involutus ATCC 200175]|uniref:Uncharacterized protein n=1 Tax=Paxillus involutus ATCC 200175 TaxID=664439 RepID=A0A0C9TBW7_PAXIN|nr:hypothetical protein PAXINDRAFT_21955 [Paxillus involutus ATCC 200175]